MSPATATTMAYPTEEEKRSHRRIGVNGDDDSEDDDIVRGNGNREERSRDLDACRVCDFKSDRDLDNSELRASNRNNESSKKAVTDTYNSDFICSDQWQLYNEAMGEESLPGPSSDERQNLQTPEKWKIFIRNVESWFTKKLDNEKENKIGGRPHNRRRKQSQPKQVICHRDSRKRYVIPILHSQNIRDVNKRLSKRRTSVQVNKFSEHRQSTLRQQRMFKCRKCPKYAPARGLNRRPYHSRTSLMLHTLWWHKRKPWLAKTNASKITLPSIVPSITLKATFFTRPNYSYHR